MAEAIAKNLTENPDIKELLELLKSPGFQSQRQEYESLIDSVGAVVKQYNNILNELNTLKEKVSKITDRKNPLVKMVENLEKLADGIGKRLNSVIDGIISFTKNALNTVKELGLSALGSVFGALHVKDGLKAISSGLAKSVEGLNNAVARVDRLEQHNRDKAAERETPEAIPEAEEQPAATLSELLADTRMDFENLSPKELKAAYEKLLAIGMDNSLTADENDCLQGIVEEISALLPDRGEYEPTQEAEITAEPEDEI